MPQGFNPDTFQPLYDGVKTPGACNNDIVISRSTNGGADVHRRHDRRARAAGGTRAPTSATDQFWQWAAFDPQRAPRRVLLRPRLRQRRDDRLLGHQPVGHRATARDFATTRVTTARCRRRRSSTGTFFGDYSGLSAGDDAAHPFWMDTRDPDLFVCRDSAGNVTLPPSVCTASATNAAVANDQNVYTRGLTIPLP